ncbi:hypothetical protein DPMN_163233 [Dreissena polymorpha]|uniref:Uncharacterized protein n=1 Tax=Dreissena polymorpha TaxID=45954 RepID=A0A9D4IUZ7_DREPO|nr:hypothetical protein DPMN_163233 [Dreissena polymorpha]
MNTDLTSHLLSVKSECDARLDTLYTIEWLSGCNKTGGCDASRQAIDSRWARFENSDVNGKNMRQKCYDLSMMMLMMLVVVVVIMLIGLALMLMILLLQLMKMIVISKW